MHWSGQNSDLKHLLKYIFRGGTSSEVYIDLNLRRKMDIFRKHLQKYILILIYGAKWTFKCEDKAFDKKNAKFYS